MKKVFNQILDNPNKLAILPIQIILATYSIDYIIKKIRKIFNHD